MNKLALAAILSAALPLATACGDEQAAKAPPETPASAEQTAPPVSRVEQAKEAAREAGEAISEKAGQALEATKQKAGEAYDATKDAAGDAADATGEALKKAGKATSEAMNDASDAIEQKIDELEKPDPAAGDGAAPADL